MQPILVPDLRVGETAREEIGMTGGKKEGGVEDTIVIACVGGGKRAKTGNFLCVRAVLDFGRSSPELSTSNVLHCVMGK